ncbi:MAG TPA: hypothetical protein VMV03_05910 [Spirochaetia bacterium]|nr:hypothetical protein [Spirochaetia bacterium]
MRRILPAVLALAALIGVLPAAAISRADFDRVVDFSITLKDLAAAADGSGRLPAGRLCVLNGTVSDVEIVSRDEATFRVRIELITGEWIGTEDVRSYSCYVEFSGPEFFKVFPPRPPRTPVPGTVVINSRVIVVGRPLDITKTPQGENRVRVEGMLVRTVE